MSALAASCHVKIADPATVEPVLRAVLRTPAWISDASGGWVSVYDGWPGRHDIEEAARLARHLSACLAVPVIGFVTADPEALFYVLHDKGELLDQYPPGHADVLLLHTRPGASFNDLVRLLESAAAAPTGRDAAPGPDFLNSLRDQLRGRMPAEALNPEALQKMLMVAAEQMRFMPPAMLDAVLASMGLPVNHPALAALKADPAAFIQQMASNPHVIGDFSRQMQAFAGKAPADPGLSSADRRSGLADALGIAPERAALDFAEVESSAPAGFIRLEP
ncbi:MAG: hypothetical protein ACYCW6_04510 [Candidatus Xenobia bacterium]